MQMTLEQWLAQPDVLLVVDTIQPPSGPMPKGQSATLKPKELGLFLAITGAGKVYAFNGHVDLGTGIRTSLAQIVAEELYLRLDQVEMVLGDTERAPNQGATIASATIQISAVPLRNAAAEARRHLLHQASERWQTPGEQLSLEDGVFTHPDGRQLGFGELITGQHIRLEISGDAPLKPASEYRLVGQGAARVDIPAKATGELTYVHDKRLPGMLHGRVIRPPYAGYDSGDFVGNSLLSVDESSIADLPGIVAVVVIRDFVGVVAEREEQAIRAAQQLRIEWKPWTQKLPDLRDVAQAIRDNPRIARTVLDKGNVEQALNEADQRLTRTYLWPYQLHASIGPSCALWLLRPQLRRRCLRRCAAAVSRRGQAGTGAADPRAGTRVGTQGHRATDGSGRRPEYRRQHQRLRLPDQLPVQWRANSGLAAYRPCRARADDVRDGRPHLDTALRLRTHARDHQ